MLYGQVTRYQRYLNMTRETGHTINPLVNLLYTHKIKNMYIYFFFRSNFFLLPSNREEMRWQDSFSSVFFKQKTAEAVAHQVSTQTAQIKLKPWQVSLRSDGDQKYSISSQMKSPTWQPVQVVISCEYYNTRTRKSGCK